jgi:hypothetical protein
MAKFIGTVFVNVEIKPINRNNIVICWYDCNKIKNDRSLQDLNNWIDNITNHWLSKFQKKYY